MWRRRVGIALALLLVVAPWVFVGHGAGPDYPPGADFAVLSKDGSKVGRLDRLRVRDKYTVFDFYADWCGPCREVDRRLREIAASRDDVAIRKLNVVDFESPLARELGPDFDALPYVVVFTPGGKRINIEGADLPRLDKALARK